MRHRCCRCGKPFIIYQDGQYQTVEDCIYHYGRLIKTRGILHTCQLYRICMIATNLKILAFDCWYWRCAVPTEYGEGVVSQYSCCSERRDSAGCQVAKVGVAYQPFSYSQKTHIHLHPSCTSQPESELLRMPATSKQPPHPRTHWQQQCTLWTVRCATPPQA